MVDSSVITTTASALFKSKILVITITIAVVVILVVVVGRTGKEVYSSSNDAPDLT
jgi:hypothetical protein